LREGLPGAGGANEQDVGLLQLNVLLNTTALRNSLVVIVDCNGEVLLRQFLSYDVLFQVTLDLFRARNVFHELGSENVILFVKDLLADVDTLVADVDAGSGNQTACEISALAAKRTDLGAITFRFAHPRSW